MTALLLGFAVQSHGQQTNSLSSAIEPVAVLAAMERVADWQLANPSKHSPDDWTQGAYYAGMMALSGISGDSKYHDAMVQMGEKNQWKPGPNVYHADHHCVGQCYAELYLQHREPKMIAPLRERFDFILANPREDDLVFTKKGATDRWSWCDSLFMAPTAWVRLYTATGDTRYLDFAVSHWWKTSDYLYSKDEHLYFRDSTYFEKREANGKKVFWSRGNGWVMGGLVRMLQYLPSNHPDHDRFVVQFREMADKLISCQQEDGLWRASLLDPASYPLKETSGSGFYTYAFAWGINQGLLDKERFEPAVRKAWSALTSCVDHDGKLTHVQPIGADPKKFNPEATEVYGVGAYLLAGSEIYRMAVFQRAKMVRVEVANPAGIRRESETVELAASELGQRLDGGTAGFVVMDDLSSRVVDSQLLPDGKLLFQVDLVPNETRFFRVIRRDALPAAPKPLIKTFARFVPERMDDFAWESDRIAHRMYGPALIKGEGTISSGIDVWVKSTRRLVVNDWYKSGKYHEDHGEGLDFYKVGSGRGCGGLGIWDGKKLFVSSNFKTSKVIATGPIRSIFELTYETWDAGGRKVSETKRISIDAGSNFSRSESAFASDDSSPLTIGVGIIDRKGDGISTNNAADGWIAYWEPEQAPNGHIACAVAMLPGQVKEFTRDSEHFLAIAAAKPGVPFVYFAGAGWSKSGDFADMKAWEAYVRNFACRLQAPVKVTVR